MPAATTVDSFLSDVKARAQVPTSEGRVTDAEILRIADDLLVRAIGRAVYDADDGRWMATASDVAITSGVALYRIPTRAWAGGLRSVTLVQTSTGDVIPLDYVDTSEIDHWQSYGTWSSGARYTLDGDAIRLLPTPTDASYSLRVRYTRRPSRLVVAASCAAITAVASGTLTVTSYPSGWSSATVVDVVRGSHHGDPLEDSVTVTGSGGTTLTRSSGSFATSGALAAASGDYACPEGYSCVLQVPEVAVGWLTELTARDVCALMGDMEGAGARGQLATLAGKDAEQSIAKRNRTAPKVINRFSPLRQYGMSRGRLRGRN